MSGNFIASSNFLDSKKKRVDFQVVWSWSSKYLAHLKVTVGCNLQANYEYEIVYIFFYFLSQQIQQKRLRCAKPIYRGNRALMTKRVLSWSKKLSQDPQLPKWKEIDV